MIQAFAENDKVELALAELAEAQAREESFFLNPVTGNNLIQSIIRYLFKCVNVNKHKTIRIYKFRIKEEKKMDKKEYKLTWKKRTETNYSKGMKVEYRKK